MKRTIHVRIWDEPEIESHIKDLGRSPANDEYKNNYEQHLQDAFFRDEMSHGWVGSVKPFVSAYVESRLAM